MSAEKSSFDETAEFISHFALFCNSAVQCIRVVQMVGISPLRKVSSEFNEVIDDNKTKDVVENIYDDER